MILKTQIMQQDYPSLIFKIDLTATKQEQCYCTKFDGMSSKITLRPDKTIFEYIYMCI